MIVLRNVSKIFNARSGPVTAVDNVNLQVEQGQIYGIIGYSGAGKSTLIRLLNGLEKPTSGSVVIAGQDIAQASGEALRQARLKISMVFQHFNLLWSRTVSENIAFSLQIAGAPKAAIQRRVQELIELVGLNGKEQAYPSQLSGGQKQRVGIARALANSPDVLLCDEATSALDPQTTDAILDLLLDINRQLKLTIVLITHEMHVVRKICHRVAVMEAGRIVEEGEVLSVFTHPQQPITRQFVKQTTEYSSADTPFNADLVDAAAGAVLKLTFVGQSTRQPIVGELTLKYALPFNILHGKMTQTANGTFGELWLQVPASGTQLESILADLHAHAISTEVVKNV
ncbi:methionine ABC transporter ATP-binding protein [Pantoea coffeiphila]|uniref:methionine ABC transporter ATP-binding protein n=1 Tax=Pantoea coffeiphila TaxID=1465635 RepID=UPI001960A0F1|nr:methionine ABC transporter ATP-binding protein [Pantoea coffeiphila]MBM7344801.1 D-methionine transport system ATP-binding protein [Pantoea coffeiphila]